MGGISMSQLILLKTLGFFTSIIVVGVGVVVVLIAFAIATTKGSTILRSSLSTCSHSLEVRSIWLNASNMGDTNVFVDGFQPGIPQGTQNKKEIAMKRLRSDSAHWG